MVVASSMKMVELTPTLHHKGAMSVFAYNPEDKEGFFFFSWQGHKKAGAEAFGEVLVIHLLLRVLQWRHMVQPETHDSCP